MFDFSNRETVKNVLLVIIVVACILFVAMNKVSGDNFFKIVDRVTTQYFGTAVDKLDQQVTEKEKKDQEQLQEDQAVELTQ